MERKTQRVRSQGPDRGPGSREERRTTSGKPGAHPSQGEVRDPTTTGTNYDYPPRTSTVNGVTEVSPVGTTPEDTLEVGSPRGDRALFVGDRGKGVPKYQITPLSVQHSTSVGSHRSRDVLVTSSLSPFFVYFLLRDFKRVYSVSVTRSIEDEVLYHRILLVDTKV